MNNSLHFYSLQLRVLRTEQWWCNGWRGGNEKKMILLEKFAPESVEGIYKSRFPQAVESFVSQTAGIWKADFPSSRLLCEWWRTTPIEACEEVLNTRRKALNICMMLGGENVSNLLFCFSLQRCERACKQTLISVGPSNIRCFSIKHLSRPLSPLSASRGLSKSLLQIFSLLSSFLMMLCQINSNELPSDACLQISHVCLCAARNPAIIAPQTCLMDASNFHVISWRAFWIFSRSFLLLLRLPSVGCSLCVVLVPNESFKSAFTLLHLHSSLDPPSSSFLSYMNKRFPPTLNPPEACLRLFFCVTPMYGLGTRPNRKQSLRNLHHLSLVFSSSSVRKFAAFVAC